MAGGLASQGARVRYAGVITTPGVAYLTRTGDFVAGVMISASHNPYRDNGLKVFGHSGFKLPDDEEHADRAGDLPPARAGRLAGAAVAHAWKSRWCGSIWTSWRGISSVRLDGVRVAIDCGNGATYRLAPELFRPLGADVVTICCEPNGRNINLNCGALHLEGLQQAVVAHGARISAWPSMAMPTAPSSFRASGKVVNGDAVLLACGRALKAAGHLPGDTVVSTVMSNLGLEKAFDAAGIRMVRTPVGDKYVLEEMVRLGAALGGEQSGHVIFREYATTGDGMLTALRLFEIAHAGRGRPGRIDGGPADLSAAPGQRARARKEGSAGTAGGGARRSAAWKRRSAARAACWCASRAPSRWRA